MNRTQYEQLKELGLPQEEIHAMLCSDYQLRNRKQKVEAKAEQAKMEKPKIQRPKQHHSKTVSNPSEHQSRAVPGNLEQFCHDYFEFLNKKSNKIGKSHSVDSVEKSEMVDEGHLASISDPSLSVQDKSQVIQASQNISVASSDYSLEWIKANTPVVYDLFMKVFTRGGILQVCSKGELQTTLKELQNSSLKGYLTIKELFEIYKIHLLEYEYFLKNDEIHLKSGVSLQSSLESAVFISDKDLRQFLQASTLQSFYSNDILVLRQGHQPLGLSYSTINLDEVCNFYKDENVDIRIQNPLDYGFNANKMVNAKYQMTIGKYREYQKIYSCPDKLKKMLGKQVDLLKNNRVFFAVNFDPVNDKLVKELESTLQNTLLNFHQSFDMLSYLDEEIPGCSLPQFYFKVKGVWTGGHQQNLCMCAININHGPDQSEWFTIQVERVEEVRKLLLKKYKIDLYSNEGLWYEGFKWFAENGVGVKRILQRKGDVVVSGPGTLHWVRAYGTALQSAWNVFPKTYLQVQSAIHRHTQNKKINFARSGTIPLKSLLLKFLNHEHKQMQPQLRELVTLTIENWLKEEEVLYASLFPYNLPLSTSITSYYLTDLESICTFCHQEVLIYFVQSWLESGIACLECAEKEKKRIKSLSITKIYHKYEEFSLKLLIERCKTGSGQGEIKSLCKGRFVGKVNCCNYRDQQFKPQNQAQSQSHSSKQSGEIKVPVLGPPTSETLQSLKEDLHMNVLELVCSSAAKSAQKSIQFKDIPFPEHIKVEYHKNIDIQTQPTKMECQQCKKRQRSKGKDTIQNYGKKKQHQDDSVSQSGSLPKGRAASSDREDYQLGVSRTNANATTNEGGYRGNYGGYQRNYNNNNNRGDYNNNRGYNQQENNDNRCGNRGGYRGGSRNFNNDGNNDGFRNRNNDGGNNDGFRNRNNDGGNNDGGNNEGRGNGGYQRGGGYQRDGDGGGYRGRGRGGNYQGSNDYSRNNSYNNNNNNNNNSSYNNNRNNGNPAEVVPRNNERDRSRSNGSKKSQASY